jgi:hypothetical protein
MVIASVLQKQASRAHRKRHGTSRGGIAPRVSRGSIPPGRSGTGPGRMGLPAAPQPALGGAAPITKVGHPQGEAHP